MAMEKLIDAVMSVDRVKGDAFDVGEEGAANIIFAVLKAMRDPDDDFMRRMYPDPACDGRAMTKQGERSRRAGRMQIAHFIDTILLEKPQ